MKKILTFLLVAIYTLQLHAEPVKLITDASQLWSDCGYAGDTPGTGNSQPLSVLIDGDVNTYWHSDHDNTVQHEHFIDVIFPDGLTMTDEESIVIKIQRNNAGHAQPTAFELRGSDNPESIAQDRATWIDAFRYAFFTFRGPKTIEYSARISLIAGKTYYRIRFILKTNNSKSFSKGGYRYMEMSEFQIYKLGKDDSYPDGMADRFHLKSDMHMDFVDYELLRTGGILDPEVRAGSGFSDGWFQQGFYLNSEGKWTADTDFFEKHKDKLNPPDYTPISKLNDSRIKSEVKYQPTHVIEHELYAIPGDAVALYPFYGFNSIENYNEVFSHWYNYETGGNVTDERGNRVLDFLIDPSGIAKSNKYGWFGGKSLKYGKYNERKIYQINSVDDYRKFVAACNSGENNAVGILNQDLDFTNVSDINPIGTRNEPFIGYFNGNGHTIKNLNITKATECVGLFGAIGTGAIIGNFVIDSSCTFTGNRLVGVIGAYYEIKINGPNETRIENIINHGDIIGTNAESSYCGGILGSIQTGNNVKRSSLYIRNCAFTGMLTGKKNNGLLCGYAHYNVELYMEHCFSIGGFTDADIKNDNNCRFVIPHAFARCHNTNCYSTIAPQIELNNKLLTAGISADEETTEAFIQKIGGDWQFNPDGFPTLKVADLEVPAEAPNALLYPFNRVYGSIATFFYPRDVTQHQLQYLDKDYYIAADFSQEINFDLFFDTQNKTIREPLINFRHIFHVKDGKKFADDNCSTKEKNEAYIRKNRRRITAEAGKYFQIRLDSPLPKEPTTRSRLYYKVTDDGTDYRRVCSMRIRVKDARGNIIKDIDAPNNLTDKNSFYAAETFQGYGSRVIDGITYNACGGGANYYRMLACDADKAVEGTFIVQLVGLDYNGEVIIIPDGSGAELLIQELEITFLPKTAAVLIPEAELKKDEYRRVTNEWLTTNFGAPRDQINYDEYLLYKELPTTNDIKKYLDWENSKGIGRIKWPLEWPLSNYSFTYSNQRDYNMYMVASHSNKLQYAGKPNQNMTLDKNFNHDTGLFDRKFYETEGAHKGFYFWVNAAADPGVMAYLTLGDFCTGSTIHVSGWVSEFTAGEMANLAINFIAVLKNGERIPLHTHTTGYTPSDDNLLGTWLYFYASFVPIFTDKDFDPGDVDHYEIELDNNCKNSGGADYAIDDIRVYLVKPVVYADQAEPVCARGDKAEIKLSAPFDVLMQSLGKASASDAAQGEQLDLYYSFVDYKEYQTLLSEGKSVEQAFDGAVLKFNYRGGDTETYFGKISFNTFFENNEEYHQAGETLSDHAFRETVNGTNMIAFNTRPEDDSMFSGKEYLVVLYLPNTDETFDDGQGPTAAQYQIGSIGTENDCSKSCTFRVMAAHSIKIDGEVKSPDEIIESCRNQSPVVQVDLYGKFGDQLDIVEQNARFDWFAGSMDEFSRIEENGVFLWDAMSHFRQFYSAAWSLDGCKPTGSGETAFTQADYDIIDKYSRIDPTGATKPRLLLSQTSYVFPPLVLGPGESERKDYVLAVPIPLIKEGEEEQYLICTQPTEVRVTVRQRAPLIKHGLENIDYPPAIDDVPMRVSLAELKKISTTATDKTEIAAHSYRLEIPIYDVISVTEGVSAMRMPGGGSPIFIAQTDDPAYKNLNFEEPVGELRILEADKNNTNNRFCALFYGNHINFHEGYTYRFRFTFEESNPNAGATGEVVCTGQDVFTIKVVPEYQKWTGAANNLNWNNDRNWSRVASSEILAENGSEFTTDGVGDALNAFKGSFAPLDFTKVIIPDGSETVPYLFDETTKRVDGYDWAYQPSENSSAGDATMLVQYDMAQLLKDGQEGIFCRPWYAHTCDRIHFEPRSQIAGQHFLHYNSASVDMEMKPSVWLSASSPLRDVVAGDMYLPTDGARQLTEYFKPITYDASGNNRFKPAVFQRSWNQASATVYKYPGDNNTENARVETSWSHVFNDVRVPYSGGHGFSVRTDLSKYGDSKPETVLFRLPKDDTFYDYYTEDGATGDNTTITRDNSGRLCFDEKTGAALTATVTAATDDNKLFLVGNPFMAHIDMPKFFEGNPGIEAKYWILTGALQGAAVMSPEGTMLGSTDGNPNYLPPLYGFFVEAKTPGKSLSLKFTADMMAVPAFVADTRTADDAPAGLRITALESGSTALLIADPLADAAYAASEDALFVNDNTLEAGSAVFTAAAGAAMTVNVCPDIVGTEVGLLADDTAVTTLRFDGVDEAAGLMLYDAADEACHPLGNGSEVSVRGAALGRLFIVSDRMAAPGRSIVMTLNKRKLTLSSLAGGLSARVYNTSGSLVDAYTDGDSSAVFSLPQGIFIVEAVDNEGTLTRKFIVK